MKNLGKILIWIAFGMFFSCQDPVNNEGDLTIFPYQPELVVIDLPAHFPALESPSDNPMTKQGIHLGRRLFYDPILSADSTMSCSTCHNPQFSFTDGKAFSKGIDGKEGRRSSMSLVNVGFTKSGLFWDGRAKTLEIQALEPIENPIELHNTWKKVIDDFKKHPTYPRLFREAFGITNSDQISKEMAAKALAQFERSLISKDSKFDRIQEGKAYFTDKELIGLGMYFDLDPDVPRAECGHCHNTPLATSDAFLNNGINKADFPTDFPDIGYGAVTKSIANYGMFKAPTLRNIKYSAPYMHDGRFATMDDVLKQYNSNVQYSYNKSGDIHNLNLSPFQIECLKAFIETFNDTTFYNNPEFKNPF